jgi:hypothetical protein
MRVFFCRPTRLTCQYRCGPAVGAVLLALAPIAAPAAEAPRPCAIRIVEKGSRWPVPLVELRTIHGVRFVSDNAGAIAFDLPELMGVETWFDVFGQGYEVPKDGFGMRGVRLRPEPGGSLTIEVDRKIAARRIGRITGAGLYAENRKLGLEPDRPESGILGCDSVQTVPHRGRLHWFYGDTTLPGYPLGIFHGSGATSAAEPLASLEPPLRLDLEYFRDEKGRPRGVAPMPGDGPTWLTGCVSLPDKTGTPRLASAYMKVRPPMVVYEWGLCAWDDGKGSFERLRTVWTRSERAMAPPPVPQGHAVRWKDEAGKEWALFGNPLPTLRCPATFEGWADPAAWEPLKPQERIEAAGGGAPVTPHSGSIAWSPFRNRWVSVFVQTFGKPTPLGEVWYAESTSPTGPWGPAVKVLSHENYTFYNPLVHPELTREDSPVLLFEGTYTQQFADRPRPTPRYDYNQVLYRLDLDDPALAPARRGS